MKKGKATPKAKRKVTLKNLAAKTGRAEAVRGGTGLADAYLKYS